MLRLRRWNELLEKSNQLEREEKELKLQLQILQAEQRIKSLKREQEQLIHEGEFFHAFLHIFINVCSRWIHLSRFC